MPIVFWASLLPWLKAMKAAETICNRPKTRFTIRGDRSQPNALSTIGYDDDGVKPDDFDIIKNGIFWDYQTTREQAEWLRPWYEKNNMPVRSHGCSYAQSWSDVAFQRMPNVSIVPDQQVDRSWNDIIAATDKGIAMIGRASYSIVLVG